MSKSLTKTLPLDNFAVENYKILELIGSGGMANIFKAIQLSLDRPIALKIMHQHLTVNDEFIARFEKEAKQAAQLQHENIVSIIDYGSDKNIYYIAMEYVEGKNLREILERQKRLPLEICLLICHQIAEGLKFAHNHNLIHRDIKPSNIILSDDGRVLLTDFGIAKGGDDLTITATGQMIGSPAYMSPEQAAGRPMDQRSDIFSLGIILFEIISGVKPFNGDTYEAMVASIMSEKPESLQQLRVDVNPEIDELVNKALVKVVDSRYKNAEEFSDRIYKELQRYKIPPVKKLISGFLKNPIKVTDKLRAEKISNHMESALYYVTMGESRLNEAKKEFQEVLRFDKKNKSAKEYLKKLESHSAKPEQKKLARKVLDLKKWQIYSAAGALLGILFVIILVFSTGGDQNKPSTQNSIEPRLTPADSAGIPNNNETDKPPADSLQGKSKLPTIKEQKAKTSENKPVVKKKKPKAIKTSNKFNYPNQNLKEFGILNVKTNVSANIFIDKIAYGKSNGPEIKLTPGRHFIEIKADGYRRMTRRIFSENGKPVDIKINLIDE